MLCEKCKIREANIKYTEVINGVKREHNLCAQCAREADFGQYSAIFDGDFPLGKLLSGLLGLRPASQKHQKIQEITCPTCGMTYEEFIENSRFGCADCYHMFDLLMGEKIRKLQENASHTGKQPKFQPKGKAGSIVSKAGDIEISAEEQIKQLERKLKAALKMEEYEEAAICRDKIRTLRKGMEKNDKMV